MVSYIKKDGEIMSQTTLDKKEVIIERGGVDHIGLMLNNVKLIRDIIEGLQKEGVEITLFDDFISFRKDNVGVDLQIKER
jgi:hypothetical protein